MGSHTVTAGALECSKTVKVELCAISLLSTINMPKKQVSVIDVILLNPNTICQAQYPVQGILFNVPSQ